MKKSLIITGILCFTLFFAVQLYAQCQTNLINYTEVKETFKTPMCSEAMGLCYTKIAKFQATDTQKYAYAYCGIGTNKKVTKKYDRCQNKNMVRCTIEWSDGTFDSYDEFCQGCTGDDTPSSVPCDWACPFPK